MEKNKDLSIKSNPNLMIGTTELKELIKRVSYTYADPKRYLGTTGKELVDRHSSYFHHPSKRLLNVFKRELEKLAPEIVLVVANQGLLYGALASHLGYEVSIIEAHRAIKWRISKHYTGRTKEIIWYYIVPEKIVDGKKYYNIFNSETVIRKPVKTPFKVGIIEIDKVEPKKDIVVVDDIVDLGLTISTVNKFVLDSGSRNLRNIVMDTYYLRDGTRVYQDALVLSELL